MTLRISWLVNNLDIKIIVLSQNALELIGTRVFSNEK
jgi:hypothetical protein